MSLNSIQDATTFILKWTELESILEVLVVKYTATTHWRLSLGSCHVACEALHRSPGVNIRPIMGGKKKIQQTENIYTAELSVIWKNPPPGHHWSKRWMHNVTPRKIIMQLLMLKYGGGSIWSGQQHQGGEIFLITWKCQILMHVEGKICCLLTFRFRLKV